jgi:glycosyltransferase involved in cell wall biosynthesis|tara:strand:- start:2015 stop:2899 length:885 start_codon:yes stop_codon:yes gene_type:complete
MKVTVGIPAYNEEKNIAKIIVELKKTVDQIIVCDDGSTDSTSTIAESLGAIVIKHAKNSGYGMAIRSIFLKAKEINADILVTIDADGQHKTEDINKIIKPVVDGQADISIGSRFLKEDSNTPGYRKLGVKVITKVTNSSLSEKITDAQSGFRAYNNKVLQSLNPSDSGMGISTEILIKSGNLGLKIAEVPTEIQYEGDTSTQNPVSHGTEVLMSTLKYISIERPLRFYGIPAAIFFVIGTIFTFSSIQYYTEIGRLNPNITLVAVGTMLIAVILIVTAILLYSLVSVVREGKAK